MADFEVKIASSPEEIAEAQRLRFQVFNLELNKGLKSSYQHGLDVDEFDVVCDHLIVRELRSGDMVGTFGCCAARKPVVTSVFIPRKNST